MAETKYIAGVASVTVNGVAHNIIGEGTYRVSADKVESLTGQDGYHGRSGMPQPGMISWKGRDSSTLSVTDLNNVTNETVVLVPANGKIIIGRNMGRVGDPIEVNTEDGSFEVKFEGPDVSEN